MTGSLIIIVDPCHEKSTPLISSHFLVDNDILQKFQLPSLSSLGVAALYKLTTYSEAHCASIVSPNPNHDSWFQLKPFLSKMISLPHIP